MQLPIEFLERMKVLTGEKYEEFIDSYNKKAVKGLRLNLHKLNELSDPKGFIEKVEKEWKIKKLPGDKFKREYIIDSEHLEDKKIRAGLHPYHEAGVYYMQEPSAMSIVPELEIREHDRVLDLCSAPGGKATQAADYLNYKKGGILVANEYVGKRARILSSNIERMGIINVLVTNESTENLAMEFPMYFSRIIVDAPCSGEGMFRKDENAIKEWSPENVELCRERQEAIVSDAVSMLMEGGIMSYSTCTFEEAENEGIVRYILEKFPEMELLKMKRYWPYEGIGEGHFLAILRKKGEERIKCREKDVKVLKETVGEHVYLVPSTVPEAIGLRVLRRGGIYKDIKKKREDYSHGYSHLTDIEKEIPRIDFSSDDKRIDDYLKGLCINAEVDDGWCIVSCDGFSLGLGKAKNGKIKNHYPKGLRKNG